MGNQTTTLMGWISIGISLIMQVFASLYNESPLAVPFAQPPPIDSLSSIFTSVLAPFKAFFTFAFNLFVQSWADHLWTPLHFLLAIFLDLSIILLLAEAPILLILAVISAIVGGIFSFFHI